MGTVSIEIPGPGTYQVQCDPKLPALADGGTSGDVLAGKQFYNDQNAPVTGTMPNNPPQAVELSGGNSYTIPRGFHDGTGKVTGVGTVLPDLPSPAGAGDILAGKQAVSGDGTRLTGIMPNNPPEDVEVSGGESYQIPEGYHTGTGKVTGKGTVLPELTDPATAADILIRKEVIDQSGQELAGTMPNNGAVSAELAAGGSYTIPAGYHNGQGKVISTAVPLPSLSDPAVSGDIISGKEAIDGTGAKVTGTMPAVAAATPTISVSPDGLITATAQQAEGYVEAATETAAQQLETQGAQTIVPGTADQTVPAGKFLTGAQTIQGDAGLLPENIKKGVSLFGVDGSYEPGLPADVRTIALEVDPPESGVATGGGMASDGMVITVSAEPIDEDSFEFNGWEENGIIVTKEPKFELIVDADHHFVAKFEELLNLVGIEWSTATITNGIALGDVAYGNGKFIAIPYSNSTLTTSRYIYTSEDCKTWSRLSMDKAIPAYSIAFGAGVFVIVCGTDFGYNRYSSDGVTWEWTYIPSHLNEVRRIHYGNGKFIATGHKTVATAVSTDPTMPWVEGPNFPYEATWDCIVFDDDHNRAIALDNYVNKRCSVIAYIDDTLSEWQPVELPFEIEPDCGAYGHGKFIIMYRTPGTTGGTDKFLYSFDGKTWDVGDLPVASIWSNLVFGSGKFVAIGNLGTALWSKDGNTWDQITFPLITASKAIYAHNRFVAVTRNTSQNGVVAYSAPEDAEQP